jgi:catechol 2,3-dioxygenase-like lactoylglutathione lyase family enzyme
MTITLNHTIVPAHDKEASAEWFAKIFGLTYEGLAGHFAPVDVDTLTLDFDNSDQFESHHYAFHVSDEDFDAIFDRVKAEDIPYGSGPFMGADHLILRICRSTRVVGDEASISRIPTGIFWSC